MPKMKTKKSASKRFVVCKGRVKCFGAFRRHLLTGKSSKMKRQSRGPSVISASDVRRVHVMMPYS